MVRLSLFLAFSLSLMELLLRVEDTSLFPPCLTLAYAHPFCKSSLWVRIRWVTYTGKWVNESSPKIPLNCLQENNSSKCGTRSSPFVCLLSLYAFTSVSGCFLNQICFHLLWLHHCFFFIIVLILSRCTVLYCFHVPNTWCDADWFWLIQDINTEWQRSAASLLVSIGSLAPELVRVSQKSFLHLFN